MSSVGTYLHWEGKGGSQQPGCWCWGLPTVGGGSVRDSAARKSPTSGDMCQCRPAWGVAGQSVQQGGQGFAVSEVRKERRTGQSSLTLDGWPVIKETMARGTRRRVADRRLCGRIGVNNIQGRTGRRSCFRDRVQKQRRRLLRPRTCMVVCVGGGREDDAYKWGGAWLASMAAVGQNLGWRVVVGGPGGVQVTGCE